jgi:hypothetical protein
MIVRQDAEIKAAVYILIGLSVVFFIVHGIAVNQTAMGFLRAAVSGAGIWILYRLIRRIVVTVILKHRFDKRRNR